MTEKEFIDICQSYGFIKSTYDADCDMTFPEYPNKSFIHKHWTDYNNKEFNTVVFSYPLSLVDEPNGMQIGADGLKRVGTDEFREFLEKMKRDYMALRKELRLNKIKEL